MRIVYSPRATADLREIAAYLKPRSAQGAKNVRDAIRTTIGMLADFPALGTPQKVRGVHKLVTRRYPYLIYYTVNRASAEVVILAIRHASRKRDHDDA